MWRRQRQLHERVRVAILAELDIQEALLEARRDRLQTPGVALSQYDLDVLRRRPSALRYAQQQFPELFDNDQHADGILPRGEDIE